MPITEKKRQNQQKLPLHTPYKQKPPGFVSSKVVLLSFTGRPYVVGVV